jgi:type I restriction enzyme R subunit
LPAGTDLGRPSSSQNHDHAEFIVGRFDANYPQYAGHFARVIDFSVTYAQSLIDSFSVAEKAPHIAVSVDMLDTGIDVPEVVNLVFFKLVRSKTKFWQMVGRGTRLMPNLFGPGQNKKFFYIFDFCQNLEFFSQNPEATEGSTGESLSKKLFANRVEVITAIDVVRYRGAENSEGEGLAGLRSDLAEYLRNEVAAMNLENFLVRPNRRAVERFSQRDAWTVITPDDKVELTRNVAGLPSAIPSDSPDAKQFDLLLLRMQLLLLRGEPGLDSLQQKAQEIARLLEEQTAIPAVAAKLPLIQEMQCIPFWEDVTVMCLERVRKGLRELVQFIERRKRITMITDFADQIQEGVLIPLPGTSTGVDLERVREKAQAFLRRHENDLVIHKLRFNDPLTGEDLASLEAIFTAEGSSPEELEVAKKDHDSLGLFVRSLVGLDRETAKAALAGFMSDKILTANQIEFTNLIINHLSSKGWIELAKLYASPYTDIHPYGVDGLFDEHSTLLLVAALQAVRRNASGVSQATQ